MTINDLIGNFSGIQVQLDWTALAKSNPEVENFLLDDRENLGNYFTPWRQDSDGSYADGNDPDAIPLRISADRFPCSIESRIQANVSDEIKEMSVPCYCLGNDGYLILDGNHRLVSLYRSKQKFNITIWAIQGPICRDILPDLACWQQ